MSRYNALKGYYNLLKTIGSGGFAKVKLAVHIQTNEKVAIKIIDKSKLGADLPRIKLEIETLKILSHANICKLYQVIENDECIFLVLEYCPGGELFDLIVERGKIEENLGRKYFRQVVAAVAYLHNLGYAHRDLKPENILIDKNDNLKLIDFGLCAKPRGGLECPLYTSCGSPTYAAPELILGREYIGSQVDVWSLGVLLYTILLGCLPFDDANVDSLYKKILSGVYEEPLDISHDARELVKAMLQNNPNRRICINKLLVHPWLTRGYTEPISLVTLNHRRKDGECVTVLAGALNKMTDAMWKELNEWKYDYNTATYLLLLDRKMKGLPVKLNDTPVFGSKIEIPKLAETNAKNGASPKQDVENVATAVTNSDNDRFSQPQRPSSIRKPLKRIRSPNLDGEYCSPVKKSTPTATPKSLECTPIREHEHRGSESSDGTPRSTCKAMMSNIERSFNKVRYVLTPKRKKRDEINGQPNVISSKDMCNISTTSCKDPQLVLNELHKALVKNGATCVKDGFNLRGSLSFHDQKPRTCAYDLEICLVADTSAGGKVTPINKNLFTKKYLDKSKLPVVGVLRKKLDGDSVCYKKICEIILDVNAIDADVGENNNDKLV